MSDMYKRDFLLRKINELKNEGLSLSNYEEICDTTSIEALALAYVKLKKLHGDKLSNYHVVKYNGDEETIIKTGRHMVICGKQGEIFAKPIWQVYNDNMQLVDLYMASNSFSNIIKFPPNCDHIKYLLEKCDINYDSFYKFARNSDNDIYKTLTNQDAIISFLIK